MGPTQRRKFPKTVTWRFYEAIKGSVGTLSAQRAKINESSHKGWNDARGIINFSKENHQKLEIQNTRENRR